jgi:hypothetical protein
MVTVGNGSQQLAFLCFRAHVLADQPHYSPPTPGYAESDSLGAKPLEAHDQICFAKSKLTPL